MSNVGYGDRQVIPPEEEIKYYKSLLAKARGDKEKAEYDIILAERKLKELEPKSQQIPEEVFTILPAYKTLPQDRKANVLNLLIDWATKELSIKPKECEHEWSLDVYGAGVNTFKCLKCGDWKSEEDKPKERVEELDLLKSCAPRMDRDYMLFTIETKLNEIIKVINGRG